MRDLQTFLLLLPILLASLTLHELAHALTATRRGDPTPREQGRLTLNPIAHLDPLGTITFVATYFLTPFLFGWARPVEVQPRYFRHPKQEMALVAAAGPVTNFVLAVGCAALLVHGTLDGRLGEVVFLSYLLNLVLGIFNLLPIPPLDGSRIVGALMDDATYGRWSALDQYGMFVIFGVIVLFREEFSTLFVSALETSSAVMRTLVGG